MRLPFDAAPAAIAGANGYARGEPGGKLCAAEPRSRAAVSSVDPLRTTSEDVMAFKLPDLPFAHDALAPHMSAETLDFHHGKHHKAYVDKTNELVAGTEAWPTLRCST